MMNTADLETRRSLIERIFHACTYEVIAIIITAPIAAFLMGHSLGQMGALVVIIATTALVWNMIFNYLFDIAQRRIGFKRTLKIRLLHGFLFEGGLFLVTIPMAAWWLSISIMQAIMLDFGLILFYLPYTVIFNWCYDILRARIINHRSLNKHKECQGSI